MKLDLWILAGKVLLKQFPVRWTRSIFSFSRAVSDSNKLLIERYPILMSSRGCYIHTEVYIDGPV